MTAVAMLRELAGAGIRLSANGNRLHVVAPAGTITPALRERLLGAKAELLGLLAMHRAWTVAIPGRPPFMMLDPRGCTRAQAERAAHLKWPGATVAPHETAP